MGIPIIGEEITLIGETDKKRAEKCLKKVQEVLDRYDCFITPVITIAGTKIMAMMDVAAKPRKIPGRTDN